MANLIKQLDGFRLVTAEILYHMPDHPALLQTYVWQDYDQAPKWPILMKFLRFWDKNLAGPIHSVTVAEQKVISAHDMRWILQDDHWIKH